MNLPNKLTIIRMIMIVPFTIALLVFQSDLWAFVIFVAASLTDFADGYIARKYKLITNFGKFMDPLADKLLVCAAMICLIELGRIPSYIVIIIISREFIVSGFRLVASDNQVVIAAGNLGKYKTVCQMLMILLMLLNISQLFVVTQIVMWIATILTVVSLIDYIYKNKQVLGDFK